jgi:hypothetical protein
MILGDKACAIGQKERCQATGCEWKKAFNQYCWLRKPEIKIEVKPELKFVPAYDTKPFFSRKKRKGRVVKEETKYTEINTHKKISEIKFENKFKTASQDDWLKKIKVI